MSLSPNEKYPGATEADPNYKDSKFKDNNPSTTNNGSPLKALDRNEQLALQEATMNAAGFDYNGVVDTPQNSQMFAAYKAALSNGANFLSNHNFIIASPDDSQPAPGATPTSYPPGYEIFSDVFANETTGILNLTYIDGRVSFSGGDFYMSVSNTGALENITEFVASVADFDGKPRTRGVSYALVGNEYRVTVGVDALEDASAALTPLGSVKFEQGSVATGHEVSIGNQSVINFGTVLSAKESLKNALVGSIVKTRAYRYTTAAEIGYGGAFYVVMLISDFGTPNEISDHSITGTDKCLVLLGREKEIWLEQYGAYNDGTQWPGISTAFDDTVVYKSPVKFGVGRFDTPGQLQYHGYGIEGAGGIDNSFLGSSTYIGRIINKVKSADFNPIKNFTLFGGGNTFGQFGIGHDSNSNGWFNTVLDHIKFESLQTCAEVQLSLSPTFRKIEMRNCGNGFFFVGPRVRNDPLWVWNASMNPPGKTAWYNNNPVFDGLVQTQCSGTAIDFVGTNLDVRDPTLQISNRGIIVTGGNCPSTANTISGTLYSEQNVVSVLEVRQDARLTMAAGSTILCAIGGASPSAVDKAVIADDGAVIYEVGDMAFLDIPLTARRSVTNNSKIISLGEYNESVLNIVDSTSRYYSLSTFVEGYNYPETDEFTNPVAGTAYPLNGGVRMADGAWEIYVTTPEGKKTSFTLYGEQSGSNWTVLPYGAFSVNSVNGGLFTVSLGGASVLSFNLNAAQGSLSVTSADSTVGTLKVASRRILERQRQPES